MDSCFRRNDNIMNNELKNNGFSLTEVLMSVGILTIGLVFIAGVFPVGIRFTTIAAERTKAAVAADEAFAKIQLYGVDPERLGQDANNCVDFYEVANVSDIPSDEFAYPSTRTTSEKQYYWSALCRRMPSDPNHSLQVTVFVSRKIGAATMYEGPAGPVDWPVPMRIGVSGAVGEFVLTIEAGKERRINDGYTIVEDRGGEIYRVVERGGAGLAATR